MFTQPSLVGIFIIDKSKEAMKIMASGANLFFVIQLEPRQNRPALSQINHVLPHTLGH